MFYDQGLTPKRRSQPKKNVVIVADMNEQEQAGPGNLSMHEILFQNKNNSTVEISDEQLRLDNDDAIDNEYVYEESILKIYPGEIYESDEETMEDWEIYKDPD